MEGTQEQSTILVNVRGRRYEVESELLKGLEGMAYAQWRAVGKGSHQHQVELYFRRNADCWEAVLDFLHTGELHLPQNVCPQAFRRELQFWGVEPGNLSKCCHNRVHAFLQDMQTLDSFDVAQAAYQNDLRLPPHPSCWQRAQHYVWPVLDQPTSSRVAKAYFCLSMMVVVLSVLGMMLSTMPSIRVPLSTDQWQDVIGKKVKWVNDTHIEFEADYSSEESEETDITTVTSTLVPSTETTDKAAGRRRRAAAPPPGSGSAPTGPPPTPYSPSTTPTQALSKPSPPAPTPTQALSNPSSPGPTPTDEALINPSYPAPTSDPLLTENFPMPGRPPPLGGKHTPSTTAATTTTSKPRHLSAIPHWLSVLEVVALVFFACELMARLVFCPNKRRYLLKWYNVADLLALISSVALNAFNWAIPQNKYSRNTIDIMEVLKVLRLLRFLRPLSHVRGFNVLSFTLLAGATDLALLLGLLFLAVIAFASIIYYVDIDNGNIISIPDSMWWAIITMTTVGYGDVTPQSGLGRLVATCCAVSGVVLLASIMPIFVNTFLLLYSYSKVSSADTPLEKGGKRSGDDVTALKTISGKREKPIDLDMKLGTDMKHPGSIAMVTKGYDVLDQVRRTSIPTSPPPPFSYAPPDCQPAPCQPPMTTLPNQVG